MTTRFRDHNQIAPPFDNGKGLECESKRPKPVVDSPPKQPTRLGSLDAPRSMCEAERRWHLERLWGG